MIFRTDPLARPEELIRRVHAYVAYRIGDGPDAEDITSEVFERALRFRASYDARRGEPAAWLIGIARRCIADQFRSAAATAALREPTVPGPEEGAAERLDVRRAVAALGERDRELIALRYGADLTAREIASLVELRTNAVEVALHRAVTRLREALGAEPQPTPETEPTLAPALHVVRV